jgi:hypothetical protein
MKNLIKSLDKKSFNLILTFENIAFFIALLGTVRIIYKYTLCRFNFSF